MTTQQGRSVLYVEADSVVEEGGLALGRKRQDLGMGDATQSFRVIEQVAREPQLNIEFDRIMRVFLGDSLQQVYSGGGKYHIYGQMRTC